jgi:hypothetical protein
MSVLDHFRARRRLALLASGVLDGAEREATLRHLDACPRCASEHADIVRVLDVVGRDPVRVAEPPVSASALATRVGARLDALAREPRGKAFSRGPVLGPAAAAAAVVALVVIVRYGRERGVAPAPPAVPAEQVEVSEDALRRLERNIAREQAARYLSEAQDVLVTVAASPRNCDRESERVDVGAEAERSRELLHRRTLLLETDAVASAQPVLDDVEQMLREVATLESCVRVRDVERLQEQMTRRQLLMKMKLMQRELLG